MATKRDALRQHRRALGYSQETLAEKLSIDRTTVLRWERGETAPQPFIRPPLAAALNIWLRDLNRMLSDTPPPHLPLIPSKTPAPHRDGTEPCSPTTVEIITEAPAWHTRQPTVHAITTALITDPHGNILLVKSAYRRRWALPGGTVAGSEPPHSACARILGEDLTYTHQIGDLLVVDWTPPTGAHRAAVHLIFDGGATPAGTTIHLTGDDLDDAAFLSPEHAGTVPPPTPPPGYQPRFGPANSDEQPTYAPPPTHADNPRRPAGTPVPVDVPNRRHTVSQPPRAHKLALAQRLDLWQP